MNCIKSSLLALCAVFLVTAEAGEGPSNFEIVTLSNRADLVSGGDALLEVRVPKNMPLNKVRLSLNGHNVTGAFTANAAARTLRGLVSGLVDGRNDFVAGESQGGREARLVITNHPIGGPLPRSPPTPPWACATAAPAGPAGHPPATGPAARRPGSSGCSSAASRTGPMTRRGRAGSWSRTTASPIPCSTRTGS